jgi:hypothetical protein
MAAIDDLLVKLGETAELMKQLDEVRGRLQGYRTERQRFADLVDQTVIERDALVASAKTALKELAAAINAAYPA